MMTRVRCSPLASLSFTLLLSAHAGAASLQKVNQSDWTVSGLPSYVNMYIYVPDKLATRPPILVASHHCQGTGASTYNETKSTLVPLADKNGFVMIFPEATGHNCWDVGSDKSLKHDGGGDTHAIAQMVRYTLSKYNADPRRVYAFGGSSGAMMTQALMGLYPDLFMAGVGISGVPCGCWAEQYTGDTATNGQWSGPCAGGTVTKTAQQWGDQVRAMYPGYTGHRPRLQLWHGDPDSTISYNNMGEAIKEWTNLLDLTTTPSSTDAPTSGTTHQVWKNDCDFAVLETFSVKGAGHAVSWDTNTVAGFLGLDKAVELDPEAVACQSSGGATNGGAGGASSTRTTNSSAVGGGSVVLTESGGSSTINASSGGSNSRYPSSAVAGSRTTRGASSNAPQSRPADGDGGSTETNNDNASGGFDNAGGADASEARRSSVSTSRGGGVSTNSNTQRGGSETADLNDSNTAMTPSNTLPSNGCNCTALTRAGGFDGITDGLLLSAIGLIAGSRRRKNRYS